jgi:hypothetical protein
MAIAVKAGIMFSEPRAEDHDGWVAAARQAGGAIDPGDIGEAFLASLNTRRLDLRSALSSYAIARVLPEHQYSSFDRRPRLLRDLRTVGTSARTAPSGPRTRTPSAGTASTPADTARTTSTTSPSTSSCSPRAPSPALTQADVSLGQQIIDYLRQLPPSTTAGSQRHDLLRGGNRDRGHLLDILGICGILHNDEHPGYSETFIP